MALKSILVKRKEKSLPSNRLECGICKQRFWMTCKYIDHMSNHKHFFLSCNICNKGFYDQKQLDEHYVTHKEVTNTFDCNQCTKKFLQKCQLEQHMQCHIIPEPIKESTVKKKKTVHFNNILESRDIDDFSDEDSDFFEDYQPSNKITKTRSGRVVKVKKLFDNEPETKRRRKNSDEVTTVASGNSENLKQPLGLETVNEIKTVAEKPSCTSSSPTNSGAVSKKFVDKKLLIVTEKIPEHIYKSYVAKGNVCTQYTSKIEKLGYKNVSSSSQTTSSSNSILEKDKETKVTSKNSSGIIDSSPSKLSRTLNQRKLCENNLDVTATSTGLQSSNFHQSDKVSIISEKSNVTKIAGAKLNASSKPDLTSSKNLSAMVTASTSQLPRKPPQNHNSPANKTKIAVEKPLLVSSSSTPIPMPRVDKQFMYVGPKQDINKIKTIIDEMKAMSNPNVNNAEGKLAVKTNSYGLPQNRCNQTSQNVGNLNVEESNTSSNIASSSTMSKNISDKCNLTNMKPDQKSNGNDLNELESKDGILEKTVLKDFILIKVTPELMQKMQRQTLESPSLNLQNLESLNIAKSEPLSPNISPGLNKDLNKASLISKITEKDKTVEVKNTNPSQISVSPQVFSVTSDSNIADQAEIPQNSKSSEIVTVNVITSINTMSQTEKNLLQQKTELNSLHNENCMQIISSKSDIVSKSGNSNLVRNSSKSDLVNNRSKQEKLLERYKSKIEEKERKKKEKYDFKKKMRYMEKILSINNPNITVSTKKRSKLPNSTSSNKCDNETLVSKTHDNTSICLLKNAESTDKSNKKSCTTNSRELNIELKDPCSNTSQVANETFITQCPSYSTECEESSQNCAAANSSPSANSHYNKLPVKYQKSKSRQRQFTEKEAVQKAYDISLKFEKTLGEKECLNLLDSLDDLITGFNISKKCPFLFPIIRFCRLYVESYKVKERAISLYTKISKTST